MCGKDNLLIYIGRVLVISKENHLKMPEYYTKIVRLVIRRDHSADFKFRVI